MYNGTFREALKCHNCGEEGHKLYNCPKKEKPTWTPFNVVCVHCGANTHVAVDCPLKLGDPKARSLHKEYDQFMSEIDSTGGNGPDGGGGGASGGGAPRPGLGFSPGAANPQSTGGGALRFPHLHPLDIRNGPGWVPGPGDPLPSPAVRPPGGAKVGETPWMRPTGMSGFPVSGMMGVRPPMGMVPMMPMVRPPGGALLMPPRPPGPSFAPFLRPPTAPSSLFPAAHSNDSLQQQQEQQQEPQQQQTEQQQQQQPNPNYQPYQPYPPAFPTGFPSPGIAQPYFPMPSQPRPPMLSPFPQPQMPSQGTQPQNQLQQQQPQQFEYYSQ